MLYFFGGIVRDFIIDDGFIYPGDFWYIFWYLFWIYLFLLPLGIAILSHIDSKTIDDYIKTEINKFFPNEHQFRNVSNANDKISHSSRLRELDKLLEEELITQSEYNKKRKSILEDL